MCAPAALAIGSSAIGVIGQIAGAGAQNARARANAASAASAAILDYKEIDTEELQRRQEAAQKIKETTVQGQALQATAAAAAADAGVSGQSVAALRGVISGRTSQQQTDINTNLNSALAQLELRKQGVEAETQSRINEVQPENPLALGLNIARPILQLGGDLYSQNHTPGGSAAGVK